MVLDSPLPYMNFATKNKYLRLCFLSLKALVSSLILDCFIHLKPSILIMHLRMQNELRACSLCPFPGFNQSL